jgi:hypothetical protein
VDQVLYLSPQHYRFFKQCVRGEKLTNLRRHLVDSAFFYAVFTQTFGVRITQACLERRRRLGPLGFLL